MTVISNVRLRAALTTCLLRRLLDAGLKPSAYPLVMPGGPRRIPGRLTVAPAPPAVSKNSGTHNLEASSPLGFRWRTSLVPAQRSLHAHSTPRDRATALLFFRRSAARTVVSAPVRNGREFDNVRHYLPGDNSEDIHWKEVAIEERRKAGPIERRQANVSVELTTHNTQVARPNRRQRD
jgi:uncharacterized protein (DUF58 family)